MFIWVGKILKDEYRIGDQLADIEILNKPLVVLSYAKMVHENEANDYTFRPHGRKDYQLLYIKKGQVEVFANNQSTIYVKNCFTHSYLNRKMKTPRGIPSGKRLFFIHIILVSKVELMLSRQSIHFLFQYRHS